MYTMKLEALARAVKHEDFPFGDLQTWMVIKEGNFAITDNGEATDFADEDDFVKNFPHIAIEDLTIEFDGDEEAVNSAIEAALRNYGIF